MQTLLLAVMLSSGICGQTGDSQNNRDTRAGDPAVRQALDDAKKDLTDHSYQLRYKFAPGETIRYRVEHLATTETTIQGNSQTSRSRSVSTKVWLVSGVDAEGNITFEHRVDDMDMWQKVSGRPEVRYNSSQDTEAPPEYAAAAKTVGIPLSRVTMAPWGTLLNRESDQKEINMGLGQITLPFPKEAIKAGASWQIPHDVTVRAEDGQVRRIKTRMRYTLQKVQAGVATIQVRTEVVTPVKDPKIRSQLVQELNNGTVRFDVDAGRLLSQQMDWDESVVGFAGASSNMSYQARFSEELIPAAKTARKDG